MSNVISWFYNLLWSRKKLSLGDTGWSAYLRQTQKTGGEIWSQPGYILRPCLKKPSWECRWGSVMDLISTLEVLGYREYTWTWFAAILILGLFYFCFRLRDAERTQLPTNQPFPNWVTCWPMLLELAANRKQTLTVIRNSKGHGQAMVVHAFNPTLHWGNRSRQNSVS